MEFVEKAAVDVPNILVNSNPILANAPLPTEQLTEGAKVAAPLACEEETIIVEEMIVQAAPVVTVNAALPPPSETKENGQVVVDRAGVLETSIDDTTLPYEPNRTMEESDDDDKDDQANKPGLDEQIALLDEEIRNPTLAAELNLAPPPPAPVKRVEPAPSKGSGVAKALSLSVLIALVLAFVMFYVVFFSSVKHPLVPKLRQNLKFLQPVADFVGQKAGSLFNKRK